MADNDTKARIGFIAVVVALLFLVLEVRLFELQAIRGKELRELSDQNRLRIDLVPAPRGIIFDRNGIPLVKNSAFYGLCLLPDMLKEADIGAIASFVGIGMDEIDRRIAERKPFEPIRLKEGLTFSEVARFEARLSDFPELAVYAEQSRRYLYGDMAAHLIGYIGRLTPEQAKNPEFADVPKHFSVGQWGVEKIFDADLRGAPGKRIMEVDALGRHLRLLQEVEPERGKDVYLSIDMNMQRKAEDGFANKAGALVALKPSTGEVLAFVSKPSFDPNAMSKGITPELWQSLQTDLRFPMLNRALQSQYPPGSTFKIITAVAALEEGAISTSTVHTCTGGLNSGKWTFGCWRKKGHGSLALHRAIVESCDVYFYNTGKKTGIDAIAKYARMLGLGKATGIRLVREKGGIIPDTEWKRKKMGDQWYAGETYNASIGQGYVSVTPAQMARMISIVSSGGRIYEPSLLRLDEEPKPVATADIKPETMSFIKDALSGVVHEPGGTGHAADSKLVSVGGKTGTAQAVSRTSVKKLGDHAWFVAFAPVDKPEVALSVFVEHGGHGGSAAAPIAKMAIDAYMEGIK